MARTSNLRRQHDAAVAIVGEIAALIATDPGVRAREGAFQTTILLARLTALLRIHFAQEDRQLYPALIASGQASVSETARRFFDEMGDLGPTYGAFVQRWDMVDKLLAAPADFERECAAIFAALADRITRENEELYPLADAGIDQPSATRAA